MKKAHNVLGAATHLQCGLFEASMVAGKNVQALLLPKLPVLLNFFAAMT
nr:hypothetical protein [Nostoc punctiforme]